MPFKDIVDLPAGRQRTGSCVGECDADAGDKDVKVGDLRLHTLPARKTGWVRSNRGSEEL